MVSKNTSKKSIIYYPRHQYIAIQIFFIILAALAIFIFTQNTIEVTKVTDADLKSRGNSAAKTIAEGVFEQINAHFHDLMFFRYAFFRKDSNIMIPKGKALEIFKKFKRTHPSMTYLNIQDANAKRIIFSTKNQLYPINKSREFKNLKGFPNRLIGKPVWIDSYKTWVLPMRVRITNHAGKAIGFIGSSFVLSNLRSIRTFPLIKAVVMSVPDGRVISAWKDGRWMPPSTGFKAPAGEVLMPISGLPWIVHAEWDNAIWNQLFWQAELPRLIFFIVLLLFLITVYVAAKYAYKRNRELIEYQTAMLDISQRIFSFDDPELIYRTVVDTIVKKTKAIASYIIIPDANSEWFRIAAVSADKVDLEQALSQMKISKDPNNIPFGDLLPAKCYREKKVMGPVNTQHLKSFIEINQQFVILRRIRSVMAYPIFIYGQSDPVAVLAIQNDSPRHFTKTLQTLFSQMVVFIGSSIKQSIHRKQLLDSEQFNVSLFDSLGAIALVIDPNGRIVRINSQAEAFMGHSLAEISDIPYFWERLIPEDERPDIHEVFEAIHNNAVPKKVENNWINLSGEKRLFEWTNTVVQDNQGNPRYLLSIGFDITERKRLENDLQKSLLKQKELIQFNKLLGETNQTIARIENDKELLQKLCDLAVRFTPIRLCWVGKPDSAGDFKVIAKAGETDYLDGSHISANPDIPEGQGPAGRSWRDKVTFYSNSYSKDAHMIPWKERAARFGLSANTTIPIFRNGQIWAVISFYLGEDKEFTTELLNLLDELGRDINFGLDHIDNIERERNTQKFNAILLNSMAAGITVVRYPDRIIESINETAQKIFRASSEQDLVGHKAVEVFSDSETAEKIGNLAIEILSKGYDSMRDVPYRCMDGSIIHIDLSGQKIPGRTGEPDRIVWTLVDIEERHRLMEEITRQSITDVLTGLPNRRALEQELERALARTQRRKKILALCMLDLDGFKPVNDTYGHDAGDEVLTVIGKRLSESIRSADFASRLGGDEFVVLIEDFDNMDEIKVILERIESAIKTPINLNKYNGQAVSVGVSIGVSIYSPTDETSDRGNNLLRLADQALYKSKTHKIDRLESWVFS